MAYGNVGMHVCANGNFSISLIVQSLRNEVYSHASSLNFLADKKLCTYSAIVHYFPLVLELET